MTTVPEADVLRDALGLLKDREQVAERLLDSSAKHSFDPDKELDWDAPFEEGKWFWPPELVSLYDTPLWRRMSEEQRIALSRHEAAALASLGIWFEIILMQLLVRHIYDKAATSAHVRYALTEIEDECRHSKMFARLITRGGTPYYPVSRAHQNLGRLFKTISTTPGSFTATLLGEEILDWMQRLTFPDERVQTLVRGSHASTWWRRRAMSGTPGRSCGDRCSPRRGGRRSSPGSPRASSPACSRWPSSIPRSTRTSGSTSARPWPR